MGLVSATTTGEDGLVKLSMPVGILTEPRFNLIATHGLFHESVLTELIVDYSGQDTAFLPAIGVLPSPYTGHYIFYVITDKSCYFISDEVQVKGWARKAQTTKDGHIAGLDIPDNSYVSFPCKNLSTEHI